jgi:hypothetical protein
MNNQCNTCGSPIEAKKEISVCYLTGMQYEADFGTCDCNLSSRMVDYGEAPTVYLSEELIEVNGTYVQLPDNIVNKLRDLEELDKTCVALGLQDKILAARHLLDIEIKDFLKEKEERVRLGQFN